MAETYKLVWVHNPTSNCPSCEHHIKGVGTGLNSLLEVVSTSIKASNKSNSYYSTFKLEIVVQREENRSLRKAIKSLQKLPNVNLAVQTDNL